MSVDDLVKEWTEQIEFALDRLVAERSSAHSSLYEAARYSLLSGGKRIRPLLTLATIHLLNGKTENAFAPACALEMVHTYSLIHDDLPCMDDDDFRRGKPSLHRVYSEGHAVLTGDFLLTYAFEVLAKAPHLSSTQKVDLISTLANAAGGEGMIGGQVLDIASNTSVSLEEIHQRKTGALFTAAIEFGGIIANCQPSHIFLLTQIGNHIGVLFQMVDDLLDQENNWSYEDIERSYRQILQILDQIDGEKDILLHLIQKIIDQLPQAFVS